MDTDHGRSWSRFSSHGPRLSRGSWRHRQCERVAERSPFEFSHRSLQTGCAAWSKAQTGHPARLMLSSSIPFADRGNGRGDQRSRHSISISYSRPDREDGSARRVLGALVRLVTDYFPWEDHRAGTPLLSRKCDAAAEGMGETRNRGACQRSAGSACHSPLASMAAPADGRGRWCCNAMSCSMRRADRGSGSRNGKPASIRCRAVPMTAPHRRFSRRELPEAAGQDQVPSGGIRADAAEFTLLQRNAC